MQPLPRPSFRKVSEAKLLCLPPVETLLLEPHLAQVPLQKLLDHTVTRLLELQAEVLSNLERRDLTLTCKWGLDGSTGHSRYKQVGVERDELMFITTLVPLELRSDQLVVWRNSTPSSPRFCRPLRISFEKETTDRTRQEIARVEAEITQLQPLQTDTTTVRYQLAMTMVCTIIEIYLLSIIIA